MTTYGDVEHRKKHKIRRLSVMSRYNEMAAVSGDLSHVRSIAIFGNFGQNSLLSFPALRVLDLGECRDLENSHLTNIGKLLLLKYLCLGSDKITELPSKIGDLQYLETLDIRGAKNVGRLPSTITRLQRLTRLYVNYIRLSEPLESCTDLSDGVIGQLQSLEDLESVLVFPSQIKMYLQELDQLTNLRTLNVIMLYPPHFCHADGSDDVERFVRTLISSYNLHHLRVDYMCEYGTLGLLSLESWCPATPSVLREISITNYHIDKVPNWMISLVNLRALDISLYRMGPEDVEILGAMPALFFL
nr:disease resistance protein Pik-2-like [Aegilops tauschii subsp. strangulata]